MKANAQVASESLLQRPCTDSLASQRASCEQVKQDFEPPTSNCGCCATRRLFSCMAAPECVQSTPHRSPFENPWRPEDTRESPRVQRWAPSDAQIMVGFSALAGRCSSSLTCAPSGEIRYTRSHHLSGVAPPDSPVPTGERTPPTSSARPHAAAPMPDRTRPPCTGASAPPPPARAASVCRRTALVHRQWARVLRVDWRFAGMPWTGSLLKILGDEKTATEALARTGGGPPKPFFMPPWRVPSPSVTPSVDPLCQGAKMPPPGVPEGVLRCPISGTRGAIEAHPSLQQGGARRSRRRRRVRAVLAVGQPRQGSTVRTCSRPRW